LRSEEIYKTGDFVIIDCPVDYGSAGGFAEVLATPFPNSVLAYCHTMKTERYVNLVFLRFAENEEIVMHFLTN